MEVVYRFTVATTHSCLKENLEDSKKPKYEEPSNKWASTLHIKDIARTFSEASSRRPFSTRSMLSTFPSPENSFKSRGNLSLSTALLCTSKQENNIKILQCNCDNNKKHSNNTNKFPILFSNLDEIKSNRKNKIKKKEKQINNIKAHASK